MPIRNPFARRPGGAPAQEESGSRPGTANGDAAHPGFERVDTVGSKASTSALSIRSGKSQDNGEYKMSVVNDSGVYLPPSPTEKDSTWPRRYLSRTSTDTRSDHGEIEHFSISRESFDSYRRSFDISARSPVVLNDPAPRQSLDSARFPRLPRSAVSHRRSNLEQEPPTPEESFEDVGLNDEGKLGQQPVRKRGFFKFGGSDHSPAAENTSPAPAPVNGAQGTQMMSRFLPGRKRGQSGSGLGAELGSMTNIDRPKSATSVETAEVQTLPPPQVQVQHA